MDLYKFVGESCDPLKNVYYDKNFKIATNRRVLCAIPCEKNEYEKYEHKLVSKENKIVNGVYPNWERVFPNDNQLIKVTDNLRQEFIRAKELLDEYRKIGKNEYCYYLKIIVNNNTYMFSLQTLELVVYFWENYEESELYVNESKSNACMLKYEDWLDESLFRCVFMPCVCEPMDSFVYENGDVNFYNYSVREISLSNILIADKKQNLIQKKYEELTKLEVKYIELAKQFVNKINNGKRL